MVGRVQTNLLILFATIMVTFSVMSVSALAIPVFKDFNVHVNRTYLNATNAGNLATYNASISGNAPVQVFNFQINITNYTGAGDTALTNITVANVSWVFMHQNDTANTTFTFYSAATGGGGGSGRNVSYGGNTSTGIFFVNISQALLGNAGNWNLTIAAWENITSASSTANYSQSFSFYIAPHTLNLTLKLNGTDGDRTATTNLYNFDANAVVVEFNGTVSNTTLNATGEFIHLFIDSNVTGWVISSGATTNFTTSLTGVNRNESKMPFLSNRSYSVTLSLTGGTLNFTAFNQTLNFTVRDNAKPTINIIRPTGGTFYESQVTLKFTSDDNVAVSSCDYQVDSGTKKSAASNTDIVISSLGNGKRTIKVICTDTSSNEASTSNTINVEATPAQTVSISTPIISAPTEGKVQVFIAKISADKLATINIDQGDVSQVKMTLNKDTTSVYINVNSLDAKPAETDAAPGTVFKYLDIRPTGLPTDAIDSAAISFKVAKSWLTENNVDENSVVLLRFAGGAWTELNTTTVSQTDTEVVFEAQTPGFSFFAISTSEEPREPAPTPTPPAEGPTPTTTVPPAGEQAPSPELPGEIDPLLIGVIVVIIIVAAVVLVRMGVI